MESAMPSDVRERLISRSQPVPLLAPTVYAAELTATIDASDESDLVKAALHVLNDDIDRAHVIAQQNEDDSTADYWHAIIHRREGDYSNAKYWFGRVGNHPVILEIHGSTTAANAFVDRCRSVGGGRDVDVEAIQWREMLALLAHSEQS